jgi:hypothetical protein
MSAPVRVPRDMVERKPPHGSPCTACGLCCHIMLCRLALGVFGDQPGPCPALLLDSARRSSCGLVAAATDAAHRNAALHLIRAGDGCDCRINGEARNVAFDARVDGRENPRLTKQAAYLWEFEL